jgi:hypothetical protein
MPLLSSTRYGHCVLSIISATYRWSGRIITFGALGGWAKNNLLPVPVDHIGTTRGVPPILVYTSRTGTGEWSNSCAIGWVSNETSSCFDGISRSFLIDIGVEVNGVITRVLEKHNTYNKLPVFLRAISTGWVGFETVKTVGLLRHLSLFSKLSLISSYT